MKMLTEDLFCDLLSKQSYTDQTEGIYISELYGADKEKFCVVDGHVNLTKLVEEINNFFMATETK